jgi:hypothetical protein
MATKTQEVKIERKVEKNIKKDLKNYLLINMPGMFDRTPDITGNLDNFVEEIINLFK